MDSSPRSFPMEMAEAKNTEIVNATNVIFLVVFNQEYKSLITCVSKKH